MDCDSEQTMALSSMAITTLICEIICINGSEHETERKREFTFTLILSVFPNG